MLAETSIRPHKKARLGLKHATCNSKLVMFVGTIVLLVGFGGYLEMHSLLTKGKSFLLFSTLLLILMLVICPLSSHLLARIYTLNLMP